MRWLAALLLLIPLSALAQQTTTGGIYVVCNTADTDNFQSSGKTACQYAVANVATYPIVTGMRLNTPWSAIETSLGVYTWTATVGGTSESFDTYVANAVAANLNIYLSMMAGTWTPSADAGATVSCGATDLVNFPVPWDPTFLTNYKNLLIALAAHLAVVAKPGGGTVDARPYVKIIGLAGIDYQTGEFHLPTGDEACTGVPVSILQQWASAGYTPNNIQSAFAALLAQYHTTFSPENSFPSNLIKSIGVIEVNSFPYINNAGQYVLTYPFGHSFPPGSNDLMTGQVLASTLTNPTYSADLFGVQWNGLSNVPKAQQPGTSQITAAANYNNVLVGWQTNFQGGASQGAWCNYSRTFAQCNGTITGTADGDFELIINNCAADAHWCEIWGANVAQTQRVANTIAANRMRLPH